MSVIIDTSVWSLALRRDAPVDGPYERELRALVEGGRAVMLGPVRQELLSGVRDKEHFKLLKQRLRAFPDLRLRSTDYEEAAECFNRCRARGVQGSNTDLLICAAALSRGLPIFTADDDFTSYQRILRLKLHAPKER